MRFDERAAGRVTRFVALRAVRFVIVLVAVTIGTAMLLQLVPGNPAAEVAGEDATPEQIAAVTERLGLDDPLIVHYGRWVTGLLSGDLGTSHRTNVPVATSISERIGVSIEIAVAATVVAVVVSTPLAIGAARRAGGRLDRVISTATAGLISMPSFMLGLLLVYVFAIRMRWFDVTGWKSWSAGVDAHLRSAFLPVLTVAASEVVVLQRILRAELITTLQQPFMAMAQSKGLPPRQLMWRHALKPSSFAPLTLASLSFARLIGGTVVVETVFALPGLGSLTVRSVQSKDLVVVQGVVAFIAIVYLLVNLAVDLLYGVLDPRVRTRSA